MIKNPQYRHKIAFQADPVIMNIYVTGKYPTFYWHDKIANQHMCLKVKSVAEAEKFLTDWDSKHFVKGREELIIRF